MKQLLFALAFLLAMPAFAQDIVIAKEGLTINGTKITNASTYAQLVKLLGKPEKQDNTEEGDIRLRYGSGGLQVYFSAAPAKTLKTIVIKPENNIQGEKIFAGTLVMNDVNITAETDRGMVEQIPGINIKYKGETGIDAQVEGYNLSFYYGDSTTSLKHVNIYVEYDNDEY